MSMSACVREDDHFSALESLPADDHRRIGREMGLFGFDPDAPGQALWLPDGWFAFQALESLVRRRVLADGYAEVNSPQVLSRSLWEASGHWDKYAENMFGAERPEWRRGVPLALKPMSCPGHVKVFGAQPRSWRDLPFRVAEFGRCMRYEPSGALQGLMRLRAFTQDDGHVFVAPEQVASESARFVAFVLRLYADLGFPEVEVLFSDRPARRIGSDETWDRAEAALRQAADAAGVPLRDNPGEGAFYGPKLEFSLRDARGRTWQCGTLQADFMMAGRLGASYAGADNARHEPVILHRAALGSLERFMAILLENSGGRLPAWMMRRQVVVVPVGAAQAEAAERTAARFAAAGLRAEVDRDASPLGGRIRALRGLRIPAIAVMGAREAAAGQVSLRLHGEDAGVMDMEAAAVELAAAFRAPD